MSFYDYFVNLMYDAGIGSTNLGSFAVDVLSIIFSVMLIFGPVFLVLASLWRLIKRW